MVLPGDAEQASELHTRLPQIVTLVGEREVSNMKSEIAKIADRKERMKELRDDFRATGFVSLRALCETNGQELDGVLGEIPEEVN